MPDVLIYGDTERVPELRHEVPVPIPDPFLYVERDGARHAVIGSMEIPRVEEAGGIACHPHEEFGQDELVRSGLRREQIRDEIVVRACRALEVAAATVPFAFPLGLAERLRAAGIELTVDQHFFDGRRRVKSGAELEGIRRAQLAAEAGMTAARELLRRAEVSNGAVLLDEEPLTVDRIKAAIARAFLEHGATADEFIVSHGPQSAIGHHMGAGAIAPDEPIVIDIWPRDNESACFADMTRTFVVGEPSAELVEWHRLVKQALDRSIAAIRPGAESRAIYDVSCDVFEEAGHPTQRTKKPGAPLEDGFFHGLGHGVGLQVHEEPSLGLVGGQALVAGDVVTVEPGLYRRDTGGCRLEDLVLVTDDGAVNLTDFPYDLTP